MMLPALHLCLNVTLVNCSDKYLLLKSCVLSVHLSLTVSVLVNLSAVHLLSFSNTNHRLVGEGGGMQRADEKGQRRTTRETVAGGPIYL